MERLSSFDTSFLVNERGHAHMSIGAVLVCAGPAPSEKEFLAHVGRRVHRVPRLRQRLAQPPLRLGTPLWVDHPGFDLAAHVGRRTLPEPGDDAQFRRAVGELLEPPLDRTRPLWQLIVVDGLENGEFAIVYKTHHAMVDGISAVDVGMLLFDPEPDPGPEAEPPRWQPASEPSPRALARRALSGVRDSGRRAAASVGSARRQPARARRNAADTVSGLREVTVNLFRAAPRVPLNEEVGPGRGFAWADFDLDEFKRIKNAHGGTVNDVALAVASGGLRRLLEEWGMEVEGTELKALVPVSIRTEDEHGVLGNKLTAMRGPLPVGIDDPLVRLRLISEAMEDLKASKQPLGAEAIWGLNDWVRDFAPVLLGPTAAINFSPRLFNLLVTNFPGPQVSFYVLGRELRRIYPIGFLARRHRLAIAILSYRGQIAFGVLTDPEAIDAARFSRYVEASFRELSETVYPP